MTVADEVLSRLKELKHSAIPDNVNVSITRNYGRKADEAVNTLIEHLGIAVVSVAIILFLFLGWREASIVTFTVPLVLAVVLGVDWVIGQTINRITLFALILSLGLLVDDAIVVIENIHRHLHERGKLRFSERIIQATSEIGRPTNIATIAVILAFIPMAFVTGMMGPFMRPIPINAPTAMIVSLATAYIVVPWIAWRWLRGKAARVIAAARSPALEERGTEAGDWLRRLYLKLMRPLISSRRKRYIFGSVIVFLLLAAMIQPLWQYMRPSGTNGPLSTFGVFPGHWLLGQPFTATSMIGVIALAGIVVRNSLLLIDFILDYRRRGHPLRDAVIEAGAVRARPILLTALAIVSASFVMVSDPVFGGLAISLIFGTIASTVLTLFVIPLLYFAWQRRVNA